MVYSDSSGKAPGGWGFYSPLSAESSLNKNPIARGLIMHFLVFVGIISNKNMVYCRMYFEYHSYWNTEVQKEFQIFFENIG